MSDILTTFRDFLQKEERHNKRFALAILCCVLLYFLFVAAHVGWSVLRVRQDVISEADTRLLIAARSIKHMLPADFHDNATDEDSMDLDVIRAVQNTLSSFVEETNFEYLYTVVEHEGRFHFAAPTVTEEEYAIKESWYFHPYDDIPPEFVEAFRKLEPVFLTYSDQWGTFRSAAIPEITPHGRVYLACADYDITYIRHLTTDTVIRSLFQAGLVLLFSVPFIFIFRKRYKSAALHLMRLNEKLSQNARYMDQLVDERTLQLKLAKEEAERSNLNKSEFLSSVAHELRTPMTSVLGFATMVRYRLEEMIIPLLPEHSLEVDKTLETMLRDLGIIISESERMAGLLGDILDLERMESGRIPWRMKTFPPGELLERAAISMEPLIRSSGLDFSSTVQPPLPMVLGDQDRLLQVLLNLLSNAAKFTDAGEISCRVAAENSHVVFSVSDTGRGIPPDEREQIFNKFVQGSNSDKNVSQGTGLGLAISRSIVLHHNGRLWVEDRPGGGSVFRFSLPALAGEGRRNESS